MQEMCFQKGHNWNNLSPQKKRGSFIVKQTFENENKAIRTKWEMVKETPFFGKERESILNLL